MATDEGDNGFFENEALIFLGTTAAIDIVENTSTNVEAKEANCSSAYIIHKLFLGSSIMMQYH